MNKAVLIIGLVLILVGILGFFYGSSEAEKAVDTMEEINEKVDQDNEEIGVWEAITWNEEDDERYAEYEDEYNDAYADYQLATWMIIVAIAFGLLGIIISIVGLVLKSTGKKKKETQPQVIIMQSDGKTVSKNTSMPGEGQKKFCSECGSKITGKFCQGCGKRI